MHMVLAFSVESVDITVNHRLIYRLMCHPQGNPPSEPPVPLHGTGIDVYIDFPNHPWPFLGIYPSLRQGVFGSIYDWPRMHTLRNMT